MAIKVVKVRGADIPLELRAPGVDQVYKITGADGQIYHRQDDVEAARLAVHLSDIAPSKPALLMLTQSMRVDHQDKME